MAKYFYYDKGFYISDIHGKKIPSAAKEITEEKYKELLVGQSTGKIISEDMDGFPILVGQALSKEVVETQERIWRDAELKRSDIEVYKVQDADPNSTGSVSLWRDYRKALRAWPANADFPDSSKRPVAPDKI